LSVTINGTGSISGLSNVGGIDAPQSGSVLQVVAAQTSSVTSTSTNTFIDTAITATITPKFSSSKILISVFCNGVLKTGTNTSVALKIVRNSSTAVSNIGSDNGYNGTSNQASAGTCGGEYLDTPATTSPTSYKVQIASDANNGTVYVNDSSNLGPAQSTIVLWEIAA
jgi:hypothetical protein